MGCIVIIGLGPGKPRDLTAGAWRALLKGQPLYLRTGNHPVARYLARRGIRFQTFDQLYRSADRFAQVYHSISRRLIRTALGRKTVYYAVPGHPMAGEAAVELLQRLAPRYGITVTIIPGLSFLEPVLAALNLDLLDGVTVLDALDLERLKEPHRQHMVMAQVYSRAVASRVKLKLLALYPPDFPVVFLSKAGLPGQQLRRFPLAVLDRQRFDHYTVLYLPPYKYHGLGGLVEIMARLRSTGGCPWDRQQDHHSLREYLVEEAYEVIAAIDQQDDDSLREELGDLLLQVVFHSQIACEAGRFDLNQVIDGIASKLIRRHPHVYGSAKTADISQVISRWEQIKHREKGRMPLHQPVLEEGLPALLGAYKIQRKAADLGFDWPQIDGALEKLREEAIELEDAYREGDSGKIEEEFGDFLFAAVNVARFLGINPELALGKAARKFLNRFRYILEQVEKSGRPITEFTLGQLDRWWEEAKIEGKIN